MAVRGSCQKVCLLAGQRRCTIASRPALFFSFWTSARGLGWSYSPMVLFVSQAQRRVIEVESSARFRLQGGLHS